MSAPSGSDFMRAAWVLARAGAPHIPINRRLRRSMRHLRAMGPKMAAEVAQVLKEAP